MMRLITRGLWGHRGSGGGVPPAVPVTSPAFAAPSGTSTSGEGIVVKPSGRVRLAGPPVTGITGGLPELKARADLEPDEFAKMVDADGHRLAWARSIPCPCVPLNRQTAQPNPNCSQCSGSGEVFFGPEAYVIPDAVGELDELQKELIEHYNASVIRGLLVGAGRRDEGVDRLGRWVFGQGTVTVRCENLLAYRDRLIDLDSEMAYSERFTVKYEGRGASRRPQPLPTKYRALGLNAAIDQNGARYTQGVEIDLRPDGKMHWRSPPAEGTLVSVHYLCHSYYRVSQIPHSSRRTQVLSKQTNPSTPHGTPTGLPVQAQVMLEHLIDSLPDSA